MANDHYELFLEEIKDIEECSEAELTMLAASLPDEKSKNRIAEGSIPYVVKQAEEYVKSGVDISDLVQEGNMAVVLLAEKYREGDFIKLRELAVKTAMKQLIEEQQASTKTADKLAVSINVLNEVATRLAASLGRQATISEIAEKMQISEDEVSTLMKTALNAIEIDREGAAENAEKQ